MREVDADATEQSMRRVEEQLFVVLLKLEW